MPVRPLTNAMFGFDSSCFVCNPTNPRGLQVAYSHDDEADVVTAEFSLDDAYSGAPSYVHGGALLALLDEAMAWACIAIEGVFGLTQTTQTTFLRPVRVGSHYRVEARVGRRDDEVIETSASIINAGGNPCAEAVATFAVLTIEQAESALGVPVPDQDTRFTRD
ncbi:MAG: PaaI family thioesterase [Acidimicrobiales bacterium]